MFENPRRGRQARNFTENDPKILDLKSSSEQIIFRKLSLSAPEISPADYASMPRATFINSANNTIRYLSFSTNCFTPIPVFCT